MWKDEVFFRAVESDLWDPDRRLEDCGAHRVDVQVLSTVPVMFGYWAKGEDALDLARFLNEHIAGCVARYPTRFIGLGTVPMQAPVLAADELERCMKELGLAGIEVGSHVGAHNLHDEIFDPLWETADRLGAAVFVHPWDMMGMDTMPRMPNGDWHLWLPWLVSMPAETSRAACSLVMGGVLDRYPNIRFLFAHGGGAFLPTMGRIKHGFEVRPDLCQTHTTTPPDAYLDRMYFDALVHDPDVLEFMLKKTTADRIALGTDYP
jgi:aminocarboxymuconate-semialdehyde decarboxylase